MSLYIYIYISTNQKKWHNSDIFIKKTLGHMQNSSCHRIQRFYKSQKSTISHHFLWWKIVQNISEIMLKFRVTKLNSSVHVCNHEGFWSKETSIHISVFVLQLKNVRIKIWPTRNHLLIPFAFYPFNVRHSGKFHSLCFHKKRVFINEYNHPQRDLVGGGSFWNCPLPSRHFSLFNFSGPSTSSSIAL